VRTHKSFRSSTKRPAAFLKKTPHPAFGGVRGSCTVRFLLNIKVINLEKAPGVIRLFGTAIGVPGAGTEKRFPSEGLF
jgi:hypothetical protein